MTEDILFCPLNKGNCIRKACVFNDEITRGEELTLQEQKKNCVIFRALTCISAW